MGPTTALAQMFRPPAGDRIVAGDWEALDVFDAELIGVTSLGRAAIKGREPAWVRWPGWSPDGTMIVFGLDKGEFGWPDAQIGSFVMNSDGTDVRELGHAMTSFGAGSGFLFGGAWSPDSAVIAYGRETSSAEPDGAIALVDVASGAERVLWATRANPDLPGPGRVLVMVARWALHRLPRARGRTTDHRRRRDWRGDGSALGVRLGAELAAGPARLIPVEPKPNPGRRRGGTLAPPSTRGVQPLHASKGACMAKSYVRLTQPLVRDGDRGDRRAPPGHLGRGARPGRRRVPGRRSTRTGPTTFGLFSCSKATNELNFVAAEVRARRSSAATTSTAATAPDTPRASPVWRPSSGPGAAPAHTGRSRRRISSSCGAATPARPTRSSSTTS